MRPLRVEFSAFGSYPGEVSVDFTTLAARGLFVVTGDTGTGKTTIFDAMSYALFGKMPSKDANDIRSHHADPSAPTYARFTFEIDGDVYTAERSPEYQRAKQRGIGTTKEASKALLTRTEPDGSTTSLATKVNDVTAQVGAIVGLDAEQFRRVMLLPQGEVARFLLDDSANRETLLGALFGGEVYDRIGRILEEDAKSLAEQVRHSATQIAHHSDNAAVRLRELHELLGVEVPDDLGAADAEHRLDRDRLGELTSSLGDRLAELDAMAEMAADTAARAASTLADAEQALGRMRRAADLSRELADLAAREPGIEATARAAEVSRRVRPVVTAHRELVDAERAETAARDELDDRTTTITRLADEHAVTVSTTSAVDANADLAAIAATVERDAALLADVTVAGREVEARRRSIDTERKRLTAAQDAVARASEQIAAVDAEHAALSPSVADTGDLDAEHVRLVAAGRDIAERDRLVARVDGQRSAAERARDDVERLLRRFIDTEAPRLAAQLVAGEPCAVCGSREHPAPAVDDGGDSVDFAAVESSRAEAATAEEAVRRLDADIAEVRARLGEWADVDAESLTARIAANRDAHATATAVSTRLGQLDAERNRLTGVLGNEETTVATITGLLSGLEPEVAAAEAALVAATSAAAGIDPDDLDRRRRAIDGIRPLVATLPALVDAVTARGAATESARRVLAAALVTAEVDSVDTALGLVVDERSETAAIVARDELTASRTRLDGQLAEVRAQGVPDTEPDIEPLRATAEQAKAESTTATARRDKAGWSADELAEALAGIDELDAGSADLRRRAELTQRAQLVCRGQVAPKVSLRRWVLGRELERVTEAASVHLGQMTGGRYTIRRMAAPTGGNAAKGLDLEILDAHTGRPRRPNSLSGGEQFQASLALALGLADVVSRGGAGSGRRIEALFIDEGFGSLDPRALDDAIETLHQLHASGRMVGAITHVEAMKERLHPGIVVSRLPDGRGSTLTVNP